MFGCSHAEYVEQAGATWGLPEDMVEVMADMTSGDERRLRFLIERHMKFTGSTRAEEILNNWQAMLPKFVKVMPVDYRRALAELKAQEEQSHVTLAAGE